LRKRSNGSDQWFAITFCKYPNVAVAQISSASITMATNSGGVSNVFIAVRSLYPVSYNHHKAQR